MKKLSLTYRFLQLIGFNYSEEAYGQVTVWRVLGQIEDYAHITGGFRLLCHQRDLDDYRIGDNAARLTLTPIAA